MDDITISEDIGATCSEIAAFLREKNRSYGNSVAQPLCVFNPDPEWRKRMGVRIDDKLSRLARGSEYPGDDTILDLIGYLVLWRVLARREDREKNRSSAAAHLDQGASGEEPESLEA